MENVYFRNGEYILFVVLHFKAQAGCIDKKKKNFQEDFFFSYYIAICLANVLHAASGSIELPFATLKSTYMNLSQTN